MEQAVDRFLYWDEEVMLYEAVTSVSASHSWVLYMSICLWVALCHKACISVTSNVFIVCLVEILDMILYSN